MLKSKSPYFNGTKNKDYVRPQFISSILSSQDKNYNEIKNKADEYYQNNKMNKTGFFHKQNVVHKSYSSINMLNGTFNYHNKRNYLNKFLSNYSKDEYVPGKYSKNIKDGGEMVICCVITLYL